MNSKLSLLLACSILTTSCSTAVVKPIQDIVKKDTANIESMRAKIGVRQANLAVESTVSRSSGSWIKLKPMDAEIPELPEALKKDFFINREFSSIAEVAERITSISGIPVNIAQGLDEVPKLATTTTINTPGQQASVAQRKSFYEANYTGTVSGFLDVFSSRYNLTWEYRSGRIEMYRYISKTFIVNSTPGDVTSTAKIGLSNVTGTGSSGDFATSMDMSVSIWMALGDSVKSMLSPDGKSVVTPALGTITVTDTPRVIANVSKFMAIQNESLSKQVTVDVKVFTVALDSADNYGINWDVVNQNLSSAMGVAYATSTPVAAGSAVMTLSALKNGTILKDGTTVSGNTSAWQGSSLMLNALSTQGDASVLTSATAVTLNNQPVPVMIGQLTSYLASSTTTLSATAGIAPTTTLTPGSLTTGFAMSILPHIEDDGKIILQYAIKLSTLTSLLSVSSNGSMIQVPNIQTRQFMQRVAVKSGETLVLAGFEDASQSATTQGIGNASNVGAGGSVNGTKAKSIIVILVRPVIATKN